MHIAHLIGPKTGLRSLDGVEPARIFGSPTRARRARMIQGLVPDLLRFHQRLKFDGCATENRHVQSQRSRLFQVLTAKFEAEAFKAASSIGSTHKARHSALRHILLVSTEYIKWQGFAIKNRDLQGPRSRLFDFSLVENRVLALKERLGICYQPPLSASFLRLCLASICMAALSRMHVCKAKGAASCSRKS